MKRPTPSGLRPPPPNPPDLGEDEWGAGVASQNGYSNKAKIKGRTSASTCSTGGALGRNGNSC